MIPRYVHVPWFVVALVLFMNWEIASGTRVITGSGGAQTVPMLLWLLAMMLRVIR